MMGVRFAMISVMLCMMYDDAPQRGMRMSPLVRKSDATSDVPLRCIVFPFGSFCRPLPML